MLRTLCIFTFLTFFWADGQSQCSVDIGPDVDICSGQTLGLSVNVFTVGDSLRIVYDASLGQSGLTGASKVYMHSGGEVMPFAGWEYPVGDWGMDNGIGEMSAIGNNRWQITILPSTYYGLPANTTLNGIFMVFRNADGTQTGKDDNGNDIFLNMTSNPPSSSFSGILATVIPDGIDSILWSTGETSDSIVVNASGTYWVQITDSAGCIATDSIVIGVGNIPEVDLGSELAICDGNPANLDAGPGFSSYNWSNGAQSQSISVNTPGLYLVTVTNAAGCSGSDVVFVDSAQTPTAAFSTTHTSSVSFQNSSTGGGNYSWDFDGDGTIDDTTANPMPWTPPSPGVYACTLTVANPCGTDTAIQNIDFAVAAVEEAPPFSGHVWTNGKTIYSEFDFVYGGRIQWRVSDLWGREMKAGTEPVSIGKWRMSIAMDGRPDGVYLLTSSQKGIQNTYKAIILE